MSTTSSIPVLNSESSLPPYPIHSSIDPSFSSLDTISSIPVLTFKDTPASTFADWKLPLVTAIYYKFHYIEQNTFYYYFPPWHSRSHFHSLITFTLYSHSSSCPPLGDNKLMVSITRFSLQWLGYARTITTITATTRTELMVIGRNWWWYTNSFPLDRKAIHLVHNHHQKSTVTGKGTLPGLTVQEQVLVSNYPPFPGQSPRIIVNGEAIN